MIRSHRDAEIALTTFVCEGVISAREILTSIRRFYEQQPTRNVLWDMGRADLSALRASDMRSLAASVARQAHSRSGGKTAIVAAGNLAYGLSRVFQISGEIEQHPARLEVFRTVEDALEWLTAEVEEA